MKSSPKKAYLDQKYHSKDRNIPWLFSYEDWLEMWLVSGQWENRGRGKGKYQMCRKGDVGAYSSRNCYIGTFEENMKDTRLVSDEETIEIISIYKNTSYSQKILGEMYGLHQSTISRIISGERRK